LISKYPVFERKAEGLKQKAGELLADITISKQYQLALVII
jgi:hypothetical protein